MKRDYFFHAVISELRFTEKDVDVLIGLSKRHYDGKCQSLSREGGFLYGMKNQFLRREGDPEVPDATRAFSWQDLDITCKILEGADSVEEVALLEVFLNLFSEARFQSETVNAHLKGKT